MGHMGLYKLFVPGLGFWDWLFCPEELFAEVWSSESRDEVSNLPSNSESDEEKSWVGDSTGSFLGSTWNILVKYGHGMGHIDIGDVLCCWQIGDVGDRIFTIVKHNDSASNL